VPEIAGQVVILTVSDAARSAAWYCDLLGLPETGRYVQPGGRVASVQLGQPRSALELCLVEHGEEAGTFSEFRAGLDHLEFVVSRRSELDSWASRLDELGIRHSGVKQPAYTANAMLTFRDPDNIQLEFFWRARAA
jgi:glyoxylase I family protein